MSNFLIGYFSRRQVFHIVAYRDSIEEVEAYLKTHNSNKLIVYASQHRVQADLLPCGHTKSASWDDLRNVCVACEVIASR